MSVRVSLLGVDVDEMSIDEAVETIRASWQARLKLRVFFVNAHCFNTAARDVAYREALGMAEMVLADGSGVLLASKTLRVPVEHNLNGTDLTPLLCAAGAEDGASVFLLGAKPGIAELAADRLSERFPGLRIAGTQHGYFSPDETDAIVTRINEAQPDILLVAMGVPLQEVWLTEHFDELTVPVCLGVGALFDFLSNSVPRAPMAFRRLGIEWLYRLYVEPQRLWRRYLIGNTTFLARVAMARFMGRAMIPAPIAQKGTLPNGERVRPLEAPVTLAEAMVEPTLAHVRATTEAEALVEIGIQG